MRRKKNDPVHETIVEQSKRAFLRRDKSKNRIKVDLYVYKIGHEHGTLMALRIFFKYSVVMQKIVNRCWKTAWYHCIKLWIIFAKKNTTLFTCERWSFTGASRVLKTRCDWLVLVCSECYLKKKILMFKTSNFGMSNCVYSWQIKLSVMNEYMGINIINAY